MNENQIEMLPVERCTFSLKKIGNKVFRHLSAGKESKVEC